MSNHKRNQVFISYSHKDQKWLDLLKESLKPFTRKNQLNIWDDSRIRAGDKWHEEIKEALERASVAVLLVSRPFLASDFVADHELPQLLAAAAKDGLRIIWIAVGHSAIETTELKDYQAANNPNYPLNGQSDSELDHTMVKISRIIVEAAANP